MITIVDRIMTTELGNWFGMFYGEAVSTQIEFMITADNPYGIFYHVMHTEESRFTIGIRSIPLLDSIWRKYNTYTKHDNLPCKYNHKFKT